MSLTRKTSLRRSSWMSRGTKPLPKVNVERTTKRRKRYSTLLAKSRKGEGYKQAMERAQGQCEQLIAVTDGYERCTETSGLEAHHLTYARFGGQELATDFLVVCTCCHRYLESLHPTRHHWSRA